MLPIWRPEDLLLKLVRLFISNVLAFIKTPTMTHIEFLNL
ncbi:hypothetical protein BBUWI9123_H0004 (plasmid) [Borreliella burgdorferi WI91-23]|nr:hypothetical protein BBUWI9123_H0004 [Borreliella burgdorferi WI91-23]